MSTSTGRLDLTTSGTTRLNLATNFENGVAISNGTLVIGHDDALGEWKAGTTKVSIDNNSYAGMLLAQSGTSILKIEQDHHILNHLQIGDNNTNAQLILDIANGKTLTVSGVKNGLSDNELGAGSVINLLSGALSVAQDSGNMVFSDNVALGYGGAVGSTLASNSIIDFSNLNSMTFNSNIAGDNGDGYGGGIYSNSSSVLLGSSVYFTGNRAGNNNSSSGTSLGGAIYSSQKVSVQGNSYFIGNLVGQGVTSQGGAIYMDGADESNAIILNADTGVIAFKDNYVNVAKDATSSDTTNSIHLDKNTQLKLDGSNTIFFDDAISSGTVGKNSLVKNGSGLVQFSGENILNTNHFEDNSVDIQNGTFRVVENASFDASGSGVFNVAQDATLAGGGIIKAEQFIIAGNIDIDSDKLEIPDYDTKTHQFKDNVKTEIDNSKTGTLTLNGKVIFDGAVINLDTSAKGADRLSFTNSVELKANTDTTINVTSIEPDSLTASFDTTITGTGHLTKLGDGILTLSGNNSYSGGTSISGGKIIALDLDALGSGDVTINTQLELNIADNNGGNFSNYLGGNGLLTKKGEGIVTLTNAGNNLSGEIAIDGGQLVAQSHGTLGSSKVNINNGYLTLNYNRLDNTINGTGALVIDLANIQITLIL